MAASAELIACRYCCFAMQRVPRAVQFVPRSLRSSSVSKGLGRSPSFLFWIWRPVSGRRESPSFVDGLAVRSAERCTSSTPTMHWTRSSPTFTVEVRCVLLCTYRVLSRRVQSRIVLAISYFVCLWILSSSFRNCNCCVLFTCWLSPCVYVINSLSLSLLLIIFTVLCGERVSQMTKTYNDVEAVTRLLEEVTWFILILIPFISLFSTNSWIQVIMEIVKLRNDVCVCYRQSTLYMIPVGYQRNKRKSWESWIEIKSRYSGYDGLRGKKVSSALTSAFRWGLINKK